MKLRKKPNRQALLTLLWWVSENLRFSDQPVGLTKAIRKVLRQSKHVKR